MAPNISVAKTNGVVEPSRSTAIAGSDLAQPAAGRSNQAQACSQVS